MKILRLSDCQRKKYPEGGQLSGADREFLFPFLPHLLLLASPRKARFAIRFTPCSILWAKALPEIYAARREKSSRCA